MLVGSKILGETQTYRLQKIFDSWLNEKNVEKTLAEINEKNQEKYKNRGNHSTRECIFYGWMVGWLDGWTVGWLDGWMVGWLDGWMVGYLFFFHTPVPTRPYTRASRGKTSLRSEQKGVGLLLLYQPYFSLFSLILT